MLQLILLVLVFVGQQVNSELKLIGWLGAVKEYARPADLGDGIIVNGGVCMLKLFILFMNNCLRVQIIFFPASELYFGWLFALSSVW